MDSIPRSTRFVKALRGLCFFSRVYMSKNTKNNTVPTTEAMIVCEKWIPKRVIEYVGIKLTASIDTCLFIQRNKKPPEGWFCNQDIVFMNDISRHFLRKMGLTYSTIYIYNCPLKRNQNKNYVV